MTEQQPCANLHAAVLTLEEHMNEPVHPLLLTFPKQSQGWKEWCMAWSRAQSFETYYGLIHTASCTLNDPDRLRYFAFLLRVADNHLSWHVGVFQVRDEKPSLHSERHALARAAYRVLDEQFFAKPNRVTLRNYIADESLRSELRTTIVDFFRVYPPYNFYGREADRRLINITPDDVAHENARAFLVGAVRALLESSHTEDRTRPWGREAFGFAAQLVPALDIIHGLDVLLEPGVNGADDEVMAALEHIVEREQQSVEQSAADGLRAAQVLLLLRNNQEVIERQKRHDEDEIPF